MLGDLFHDSDCENSADTSASNQQHFHRIQKPPESRGSSGFVGLDNQGATCYLNSLVQALYMTPELRMGLFAIDPKDLGANVAGSSVDALSCDEIDNSLIDSMKQMGFSEEIAMRCLCAANNKLDAAIEYGIANADQFENVESDISRPKLCTSKKVRSIPLEMQKLFAALLLADKKTMSTTGMTDIA